MKSHRRMNNAGFIYFFFFFELLVLPLMFVVLTLLVSHSLTSPCCHPALYGRDSQQTWSQNSWQGEEALDSPSLDRNKTSELSRVTLSCADDPYPGHNGHILPAFICQIRLLHSPQLKKRIYLVLLFLRGKKKKKAQVCRWVLLQLNIFFSALLALQWLVVGEDGMSLWSPQGMLVCWRIFFAGESPTYTTLYIACFSSSGLQIWWNLWYMDHTRYLKKLQTGYDGGIL